SCKNLICHIKNKKRVLLRRSQSSTAQPLLYRPPLHLALRRRRRVSLDGRSRRARSTPLAFKLFPRTPLAIPPPPLHLILTEHRPPALPRAAIAIRLIIIAVM